MGISKILIMAGVFLALGWTGAAAGEDLEGGLIAALRLDKKTGGRLADSGKAIQAYMREGVVDKKPNRRFDYTDYYLVRQPAKLMGHDLVMIEEEYLTQFIGCCVNEGMGVTVKTQGGTENLEKFAEENGCAFSEKVDFQNALKQVGIKVKAPTGEYASLSCRERDAHR